MDYDVMSPEHFLTNWLQDKKDALTALDLESQYAELARNLKQREDTLYVVAMKVITSSCHFIALIYASLLIPVNQRLIFH